MDRLSALPNEILDLISAKIADYHSLFSLTLMSRNFYDVFNFRLYQSIYLGGQFRTLALSSSERLPLTGPHPASFVKTLHLHFSGPYGSDTKEQKVIREDLFKRQAASVLENVALYGAGTLHSLNLWFSEIPIHEVVGNVNFTVFGYLKKLSIYSRGSILTTPSLNIFGSLCQNSPSLTSLDLRVYDIDNSIHVDPVAVSRLVERIPQNCPKLETIRLSFSNLNQSHESIQRVLDDPNFTFPLLLKFCCDNFWEANAFRFFLRHPGIVHLACHGITVGGVSFEAPTGFLPDVRHFSGNVSNYVALCTEHPPPVEYLSLGMLHHLRPEEDISLISGLKNTKTLRQLTLSEFDTDSLVFLGSIIRACPGLTHLTCEGRGLGEQRPATVSNLYSIILHDLPNLEHLLLRVSCSSVPDGDIFYTPHIQALSSHRSLRTVQISLLVDEWVDFCFVKEKDKVTVVSKSDLNAGRFHEFS